MHDATQLVRSYLFLRRGLGLMGIALPFVLILGTAIADGDTVHVSANGEGLLIEGELANAAE